MNLLWPDTIKTFKAWLSISGTNKRSHFQSLVLLTATLLVVEAAHAMPLAMPGPKQDYGCVPTEVELVVEGPRVYQIGLNGSMNIRWEDDLAIWASNRAPVVAFSEANCVSGKRNYFGAKPGSGNTFRSYDDSGNLRWELGSADVGAIYSAAFIDDLNGDGVGEVVLGTPWQDLVSSCHYHFPNGRVTVVSGADGTTLYDIPGSCDLKSRLMGYKIIATPDADGDGLRDFIVGNARTDYSAGGVDGDVRLFSSRTGQIIWRAERPNMEITAQFGADIDLANVVGDSRPEVIIAFPGERSDGSDKYEIYFADFETGELLGGIEAHPYAPAVNGNWDPNFGKVVDVMGDLDGDGYDELVVAAQYYHNAEDDLVGKVFVLRPQGGEELCSIEGLQPRSGFGRTLAAIPDINADGIADFVVGSPLYDEEPDSYKGAFSIHSGATCEVLNLKIGEEVGQRLGAALAATPVVTYR